jgi:endoglycosylceramidase
MIFFLLLLLLLVVIHALIHVEPNGYRSFFVDDLSRVRVFHGVNAVFKEPPFLPRTDQFDARYSLAAADIANLDEWGFNVVRLGVLWVGAEPADGQVNATYLAAARQLVDALGKAGIYSIVDQHQDVLNRKFCGEGFPDWSLPAPNNSFPFPIGFSPYDVNASTGYPSLKQCLSLTFGDYYASFSVAQAFQALYDNTNGLQDRFARFWSLVAKTFVGDPYVLGYELINEPFLGDIYAQPDLLFTQRTDSDFLMPMYDKLATAIRKYDDDHIVFFEKATGNYFLPLANGFSRPPIGNQYCNRSAYSYHEYCSYKKDDGSPVWVGLCEVEEDVYFQRAIDDAARLNVAGMLTEFGSTINSTNAITLLNKHGDDADTAFQSWAYWQFKDFDDITSSSGPIESFYNADGALQLNKLASLSRTYATAIAGRPTLMKFDTKTKQFQLVYKYNAGTSGATEIYLNEAIHYPRGFAVAVTPASAASWRQVRTNRMEVTHSSGFGPGVTISVTITAN